VAGETAQYANAVTTFLFDLDGTLYHEGHSLPGALEAVSDLSDSGHQVLYATNDATLTGRQHACRLRSLGFPAADTQVLTSGGVTARWLAALPRPPKRVLVVGPEAISAEIVESCPWAELVTDGQADAVVIGLDRDLSYAKLTEAFRAVIGGAQLLATNSDRCFPGRDGKLLPGAGAITAAVEAAAGVSALVLGKPRPALYADLLAAHGADPHRTVVVGDSLTTDIAAAHELSLYSVLVLTGVTGEVPAPGTFPQPHLVIRSLAELLPALRRARPQLIF